MISILGTEVCSCKTGAASSEKKPLMVDKILETDREEASDYDRETESPSNFEISKHETVLIDLIEQKRAADRSDKVRSALHVS